MAATPLAEGFEHMGRLLVYFATVLFSPDLPMALLMFALAIIGGGQGRCAGLASGSRVPGVSRSLHALLLNAGTMVVRNLLR